MEFQTNDDLQKQAYSNDESKVFRQSKMELGKPYKFRFLSPIIPVEQVFYKCLFVKNDGSLNQGFRVIRVPINFELGSIQFSKVPTILDDLAQVDLAIRAKNRPAGVREELKSVFEPQRTWIAPVFDRNITEEAPTVRYFQFGAQVYKQIRELQQEPDEDDNTKLANCPFWCHDMIVTKVRKDPNKAPTGNNIEYKVKMAKNNRLAGKIPADVIDDSSKAKKIFDNSVKYGIFTEDEFAAVSMFSVEAEMLPVVEPHTNEAIIQMFQEAPIALDGTGLDGGRIFPDPKMMEAACLKLGVNAGMVSGGGMPQLTGGDVPSGDDDDLDFSDLNKQAAADDDDGGIHDLDPDKELDMAAEIDDPTDMAEEMKETEPAKKTTAPKSTDDLDALMGDEESAPVKKTKAGKESGDRPDFLSELDDDL